MTPGFVRCPNNCCGISLTLPTARFQTKGFKRKYKQMVRQYHPDQVAHLGPELKELAAWKTTEINMAFAAIRRIRGF